MKTDQATIVTYLRLLYPVWMLTGIFGIIYIPSTLIDSHNPLNTIHTIENNLFLFRLGIAMRLFVQLLFIIIPFLFYKLFKVFNSSASLIMLIFALVSIPIAMYSETHMLNIASSKNPTEVMSLLSTYKNAINIATLFWGLWLFPLGWLAYTSKYFPKLIGVFLYIGGLGYLIDAFITIIAPQFNGLSSTLEFMTFGELLFILWFVIKGVKKQTNNTAQA